jgi:hypothetical protein
MALAASVLQPQTVFDSFLFAPVGEDDNGMVVSVLSAFARLDFDPWQKAAEFARLPAGPGRTKLAAMIAALPAMSVARTQADIIADRLIALLPGQLPTAIVSRNFPKFGQSMDFKSPRFLIQLGLLVAFSLASQIIMIGHRPQSPADGSPAQISSPIDPPAPVPSHGDASPRQAR